MAIVSRLSVERAQSVKVAVKKGLTKRLLGAVRGDTSSSSDASSDENDSGDEDDKRTAVGSETTSKGRPSTPEDDAEDVNVSVHADDRGRKRSRRKHKHGKHRHDGEDLEMGDVQSEVMKTRSSALEQSMPDDAVLTKASALEYLQTQGIDPAIMPIGIITLEDVLEGKLLISF